MDRLFRLEHGFVAERAERLHEADGDVFGAYALGRPIAGGLADLKLLAPVRPSKIVCVGLNYKDHAAETGHALPAERRQASSTKQPFFTIGLLVECRTCVMWRETGDTIATGTPEGIGPLTAGDTVTVKIEGVGELSNPVKAEV